MRLRQLVLLAALLWCSAFALTILVVSHPAPIAWDAAIEDAAHSFARDHLWVVTVCRVFALMGSVFVVLPAFVVIVVLLARRGYRWWAWWLGLAGMGGWIISETVKHLVDRHRPVWVDPFETLTSPSFPSGHSMAGIYGWVAFGVVAWALWNRTVGVACMVFGVLMGPSRVLLGVHWPTDVLGGWLFAAAWLLTVTALVRWRLGDPEEVAPARDYRIAPGA